MTDIRATWYLTNSEEVTEWKICVTRLPSQKAWRLSEIRRTKCLVFGRGIYSIAAAFTPPQKINRSTINQPPRKPPKNVILVGIELFFYLQYIVVKTESFVRALGAAVWAGKFVCTPYGGHERNIRLVFCKKNPSSLLTGMHEVKTI